MDSTLIARKVNRTDVKVFYIPATQMASDEGITTLANMIILGQLIRVCDAVSGDNLEASLKKVVSARRADMLELNKKAIELGFNYAG